jgi:hypothetical protein
MDLGALRLRDEAEDSIVSVDRGQSLMLFWYNRELHRALV